MSNENGFMAIVRKNPVTTGVVTFAVVAISIIVIVMMMKKNNTPKPTTKEGFSFSDTFALSNMTNEDADHIGLGGGYEENGYENEEDEIVENFPQPAPQNVMYSDANGNLATTTDLGLQNLTIAKDGALLIGDKFRFNANKDAWRDDEWLRMMNPQNTGYGGGLAADKLYGASTIISDGTISAVKTISTNAGYAMLNNRNVKPDQLAGGNLQFGFGSMDNNSGAPFADTIHLNGWGDATGGKPNLVMFDKSKPGMRIYQGEYNSGTAYNTYKDAVMADSSGNASVNGKLQEGGNALIPRGTIVMWNGAAAPAGWAICDGGNSTPDLRNRFIVGAGSGSIYGVGETGGAKEVTLTVGQMPSHNHIKSGYETLKLVPAGSHQRNLDDGNYSGIDSVNGALHTLQNSFGDTGGNQPHENRPPFYALCYIMKL